jgi:hypothetical protein
MGLSLLPLMVFNRKNLYGMEDWEFMLIHDEMVLVD